MTHKTRRVLLYISIIIFTVATGPIVFYTLGYRISLTDLTVHSTGGLFVVTRPTSATVYVNASQKETSLIAGSIFVQNLTPGPYDIRVEKQGYYPWNKRIPVEAYAVTEARVVLIPQEPVRAILATSTYTDMRSSPHARTFLLFQEKERAHHSLAVFDTNRNSILPYDDERTRTIAERMPSLPTDITWSTDELSAIGKTSDDWITITLTDRGTVRMQSLWRQSGLATAMPRLPRAYIPHPQNTGQFYVLNGTNLAIWNEPKRILRPLLSTISAFAVQENTLLLLDTQSGLLLETDLEGHGPRAVSPAHLSGTTIGTMYAEPTGYTVRTDTDLWFISPEMLEPLHLTDRIRNEDLSVATNNVLWHRDNTIGIYWIAPEKDLPYFQDKRIGTLPAFERHITTVFRYPRQMYLIVQTGSTVSALELDGRGGTHNSALLYTGTENLKLFVPENERAAYVLDAGALIRITLP